MVSRCYLRPRGHKQRKQKQKQNFNTRSMGLRRLWAPLLQVTLQGWVQAIADSIRQSDALAKSVPRGPFGVLAQYVTLCEEAPMHIPHPPPPPPQER